jgi:two-component system cell cycle response regulator DivK
MSRENQEAAKKILIIDDDARNVFALNAVLKAKGYTSISASNALDGLQLLDTSNDIGIVLVDMMMPEMDGYEMLAQIRAGKNFQLPVAAVTAQVMTGDKERCLQAGADVYLSKPIEINLLLRVLDDYDVRANVSVKR